MDVTQPSISSLMVPFSAAALLAQQEKHLTDSATGSLKEKLQVKRANIDHHVFGGGIARGNVVGFSCGRLSTGPPGGGAFRGQAGDELTVGRLLCMYVLVNELLAYPTTRVAAIDSTGQFSVPLLARVIRQCLTAQEPPIRDEALLREKTRDILARIAITRVFDIEGLWEVIGDLNNDAHYAGKDAERQDVDDCHPAADAEIETTITPEIADSQEEDDEDLAATPPPRAKRKSTPPAPQQLKAGAKFLTRPSIILIDSMTPLLTAHLSGNERTRAHDLLSQLSHTLTALTRSSDLTLLMLNTLTSRSASQAAPDSTSEPPAMAAPKSRSVFLGAAGTPSLGTIFDQFLDLHVMVHALPATAADAEKYYYIKRQSESESSGSDQAARDLEMEKQGYERQRALAEVEFANIIEVLRDDMADVERWDGVGEDEVPTDRINLEGSFRSFRVVDGVDVQSMLFSTD